MYTKYLFWALFNLPATMRPFLKGKITFFFQRTTTYILQKYAKCHMKKDNQHH